MKKTNKTKQNKETKTTKKKKQKKTNKQKQTDKKRRPLLSHECATHIMHAVLAFTIHGLMKRKENQSLSIQ